MMLQASLMTALLVTTQIRFKDTPNFEILDKEGEIPARAVEDEASHRMVQTYEERR